jgi:hypothetical protein
MLNYALSSSRRAEVVYGASGLWIALLGLALGSGVPPAPGEAAESESAEDLLAFLEFLGDEETAGEVWNGFFDSLPERPEDLAEESQL